MWNPLKTSVSGSGHITDHEQLHQWANKTHEQSFNVMGYGATGNGTTNDTASIQAAVDAADADVGGIVFFPPGQYRTTRTINVPPGIILLGHGERATTINAETMSGQWAVEFLGGDTGDNHIGGGMEKMTINAATNPGQHGLHALSCHRMKFRDLHINGGGIGGKGFTLEEDINQPTPYSVGGMEWNTLDSVMVRRFTHGFQIYGHNKLWGNRNVATNLWAQSCDVGFAFKDCDTNVMQLRPQDCRIGVHLENNSKYNSLDIREEASTQTGLKFSGYVWQNFITGSFSDPDAWEGTSNQASHATRWNTVWRVQGPDASNVYGTAKYGIFGADPQPQQTVTGSKGGNTALASLIEALTAYGIIKNNTT